MTKEGGACSRLDAQLRTAPIAIWTRRSRATLVDAQRDEGRAPLVGHARADIVQVLAVTRDNQPDVKQAIVPEAVGEFPKMIVHGREEEVDGG